MYACISVYYIYICIYIHIRSFVCLLPETDYSRCKVQCKFAFCWGRFMQKPAGEMQLTILRPPSTSVGLWVCQACLQSTLSVHEARTLKSAMPPCRGGQRGKWFCNAQFGSCKPGWNPCLSMQATVPRGCRFIIFQALDGQHAADQAVVSALNSMQNRREERHRLADQVIPYRRKPRQPQDPNHLDFKPPRDPSLEHESTCAGRNLDYVQYVGL